MFTLCEMDFCEGHTGGSSGPARLLMAPVDPCVDLPAPPHSARKDELDMSALELRRNDTFLVIFPSRHSASRNTLEQSAASGSRVSREASDCVNSSNRLSRESDAHRTIGEAMTAVL